MTETQSTQTPTRPLSQERRDLLETLRAHRRFLRTTVQGLTEDQARTRSTPSELTLGGLIKHVARTESVWADFVVEGPSSMAAPADADYSDWKDGFRLTEEETLAGALARYDAVAARTDELVETVDLDRSWPLPPQPWFEPGATRSARRVFTHIVAETAQHAGHADIIREAIDGQRTMG
ncbi:MAG: DinB family protein [Nocardioides sp.]